MPDAQRHDRPVIGGFGKGASGAWHGRRTLGRNIARRLGGGRDQTRLDNAAPCQFAQRFLAGMFPTRLEMRLRTDRP